MNTTPGDARRAIEQRLDKVDLARLVSDKLGVPRAVIAAFGLDRN